MIVHCVHRANIPAIWPMAFEHLQKSFPHSADPAEAGRFPGLLQSDPSTMLVIFLPGPAELPRVLGAAILQDTDQGLHVRQLAGKLPENWAFIFDAWLVNLARVLCRSRVTANGRPGWKRKLSALGWTTDETGLLIREVEKWRA